MNIDKSDKSKLPNNDNPITDGGDHSMPSLSKNVYKS